MSRKQLLLLLAFLAAIPALPIEAIAQVNLPTYRNLATGELVESSYAERYRQVIRDQVRKKQLRRSEKLLDFPEDRTAAYAADACGLGCDHHEGLQVQGIPGTFLSVALYKTLLDDDVLTVQLRFHNDGTRPQRLTFDAFESPESLYVQVGEERLHVLEDEDGELEAKHPLDLELDPGEIESWWARFPAPLSEAKTFDLHIPAGTFHHVPLEVD